jgi:putative endonuclease
LKNYSQNTGKDGEETAKRFLLEKGHEILETNWRFKKYEVDIISKTGQTIVFVEVKTRKSDTFGEPETFVNRQKQNFLVAAAHQYITQNNIDLESRFDIIAILQLNNNQTVKHLEAAFYPQLK